MFDWRQFRSTLQRQLIAIVSSVEFKGETKEGNKVLYIAVPGCFKNSFKGQQPAVLLDVKSITTLT